MKIKKLLAGIAAVFLAGACATPAFAEGYKPGDTSFTSYQKSTVTLYKLKENDGSYETSNGVAGENNEGREGIPGVVFRLLRVATMESVYREADGTVGLYYCNLSDSFLAMAEALNVEITPAFTQTETYVSLDPNGEDEVVDVSYYTLDYINGLLEQMKAAQTADGIDGETYITQVTSAATKGFYQLPATDENGMTSATVSHYLYLVVETDYSGAILGDDEAIYRPSSPFLLQAPMTNTTEVTTTENVDGVDTEVTHAPGTLWQKDIVVYPKNNTITAGKKAVSTKDDSTLLESEDVSIGDTVTEVIYCDVPVLEDGGVHEKYVIRDEMTEGLTFSDIVSVRLGNKAASAAKIEDFSGLTELTEDDYTVTSSAHAFAVELTAAGLAKLDALTSTGQILVTFHGVLNGAAAIGSDSDNSNSPTIVWKTSGFPESTLTPSDVKVYTYGIHLKKEGLTDPTQSAFRVFTGSTYQYMDFVKEADGVYHLYDGGKADASGTETTKMLHPDSAGDLKIEGLDEGITYTIEETATQPGYQLLRDRIRVTFTAADPKDGTLASAEIKFDNAGKKALTAATENGMVTFSVTNYPGLTLHTGGSGTAMFYLAGIGMLAFAGVFLALGRKKSF